MSPEYITISVATLRAESPLGVDLYRHDSSTNQIGLFKKADHPLTAEELVDLREHGTRRLYITRGGQDRYQEYLRLLLADSDGQSCFRARAGAMDEVVRDILRESFQSGDMEQTVQNARNLGDTVVSVLADDQFTTDELLQLLHHDYTTFTHSANVAYYAVILAKQMGLPTADLRQIAGGALLHDIGKIDISDAVLCKPGRLDEFEMRSVQQHPLDGFRKLCRQQSLTQGQLLMAYQHHEKLDGSGYPVGCVSNEIHYWAKLCAVVDSFESLTSIRPYRGPRSLERALHIMEHECGHAYDRELFQCWKQTIQSCSHAS